MTDRGGDVSSRAHYRRFYETDPAPGDELLLVIGNCQAESVRLLLDPEGSCSVRVPPIFELDEADVRLLQALLARSTAVAVQPVRDDYRGLPLGTDQLTALMPAHSRLVRFPIVRFTGLHPFQVVVHSRYDASGRPQPLPEPPVAAYHDLRVVAAALGLGPATTAPEPDAVLAVAEASRAELRRRESATDVVVSAALARPGAEHMRTVNHPGNPVLLFLAGGVADVLGWARPVDPGRPLLDSVRAPIEPVVAAAWGLDPAVVSSSWRLGGRTLSSERLAEEHLAWYAAHPGVARAVWERHEQTAGLLGLG